MLSVMLLSHEKKLALCFKSELGHGMLVGFLHVGRVDWLNELGHALVKVVSGYPVLSSELWSVPR